MRRPKNNDEKDIYAVKDLLNIPEKPAQVPSGMLNEHLLARQGITRAGRKKIQELHEEMNDLFVVMEAESDPKKLKEHAKTVEKIEFKMQAAWKFKKDATRHTWWCQVPHCSCPVIDNQERRGAGQRIIDSACIVHG
jgi:hypothetical protein